MNRVGESRKYIKLYVDIYLFGVLRHFQNYTGRITMGSWKVRGNQYIQFVRVLYCKLPTNGKQLPAFPLEATCWEPNYGHRGGRQECYHSATVASKTQNIYIYIYRYEHSIFLFYINVMGRCMINTLPVQFVSPLLT